MVILNILLFVDLVFTCTAIIYYLRKTRIVSIKIKEAYTSLDETAIKREREAKRNVLTRTRGLAPRKGIRKWIESSSRLFVYSRLGSIFPGLTYELWTLLVAVLAAVLYFAVMFIRKEAYLALIVTGIFLLVVIGVEKLLAFINNKRVDDNLIQFMNMAENYNATNSDITSILRYSGRKLPDPLKAVIEEFYIEAETTGDKTTALYAMAEKIEHPKFKEFVCDMEIGMKYCADFSEIIRQNRQNMRRERRAKKERVGMAEDLIVSMLITTFGLIWIMHLTGGSLKVLTIWEVLFGTPIGHVFLAGWAVLYILFLILILRAER